MRSSIGSWLWTAGPALALPGMTGGPMIYTEQHRELMRSVTKFIESEINPHAEEWEKEGIFPAHALFKKMGDQGLLGIHKPEKFGGQGLDYSDRKSTRLNSS